MNIRYQRFDVACPGCGKCRTVKYETWRKIETGVNRGYCTSCAQRARNHRPLPGDQAVGQLSDREIAAWAVGVRDRMTAREWDGVQRAIAELVPTVDATESERWFGALLDVLEAREEVAA